MPDQITTANYGNPSFWTTNTDTTLDLGGIIEEAEVLFQEDDEVEEYFESVFDDYTHNEPFEYGTRWYVVMYHGDGYGYEERQTWYSERESCEFRLLRRVPEDLFGASNAFRIQWLEETENQVDDGYSEEREEVDVRDIAPVLTTIIGRNIPLISIEQEFSGNGELVSRELADIGLAYSRYVEGYHMSEARHNSETDRICYVETDSSCGYEIVFSKINLKNRIEAEKISRAQIVLRRLKNEGHIRLSARCGLHIHVDVNNWGMKEIVSAYHLWNYLEDTVFRFASAFWATHRDEEVGGGYSTPTPKGYETRSDIGNVLNERRDALNFSHILRAKGNCRCGAGIYEDWANCRCNLSQPTLEFRVFNATLNQRKIRAYLAFCVAFVNMAKKHDITPDIFPEMRWAGTHIRENSAVDYPSETWEERSVKRINYILREFPLTNTEKSDIMYCLRNCSLEPVLELL